MANGLLREEEKEFKTFYKRALWWVEHREILKQIGLIFWMICDAILIIYASWGLIDGFVLNSDSENRYVATAAIVGQTDLHAFTRAHAAKPIGVGETSVFPLSDRRYDFYTSISNPNTSWYADFEYTFSFKDGETTTQNGFLLPGEEKPLVFLAHTAPTRPMSAGVRLSNVHWHRIDRHVIPDYEQWYADRMNFSFQNILFTKDLQVDSQTIGQASFEVKNRSAFSFWEPNFFILLLRGNSVVGVTRTTLEQFKTGEMREVKVNWFGPLPAVSKVEVIAEMNPFDKDVFMSLGK
jgi:hypothetical protein